MMNQWLEDRCWSNYPLIKGDICAVALNFNGLGGGVCTQWYPLELGLAEKNILTVTPYYGPWSWMNRQSRMFVDELVGRVYSDLQLAEDIPLVSCGGSMGGCASLLYCRYGKKAAIACDALYPVCDVKWHFRERSDIAPSMCRAFTVMMLRGKKFWKNNLRCVRWNLCLTYLICLFMAKMIRRSISVIPKK